MSLSNFVWSCAFIYLHDCILVKHLQMHQKTGLKTDKTTDKTVQNFTQANTYVCAELLIDGLSARMMLMLHVLLVVAKIVHAQTVKFWNRHFIKLV